MLTIPQQLELINPYVTKEVKQAMFSTNVKNNPGPDRYGSGFSRDS